MQALRVEELSLILTDGTVLCHDLSFTIEPGEVMVLMGPSGCGKSSILAWLTGTLSKRVKATGSIWLGETCLNHVAVEKRRLGLMLQQDYLFPHMSVAQNLKFGLRGGSKAERDERVKNSLQSAGLDGLSDRDPATLSGGQRARVSLLRTLLSDPSVLLLDEPFSRLDTALRAQIREFTWAQVTALPTLLVTHDAADIPPQANLLEL